MKRHTVSDVAKRARVSSATVSRVLNGRTDVDPEMAKRVREAADELDYRPSRIARSLRTQRSAVWAFVVSDIRNPFFTDMVRGVEDIAADRGHSVVLCNTDESEDREREYLELILDEQMAGAIVSLANAESTQLTQLVKSGMPVVVVDRIPSSLELDSILLDNRRGSDLAVSHLLSQGYERIACISGPKHTTTGKERAIGYLDALAQAGAEFRPEYLRYSNFKNDGGYHETIDLLSLEEPPDALFVGNTLMVMGALKATHECGTRIPEELGLVTFDDFPWAPLLAPPLTTVGQPTYEMGREAALLLERRSQGDTGPTREVVFQPSLQIRASSAGPTTPPPN